MSRSYKPTELKRRLRPAIIELERQGFLEPMAEEDRYLRKARGSWQIVFLRGPRGRSPIEPTAEERAELVAVLTDRGVTSRIASDLVERYSPEMIRTKVAIFDWMVAQDDKRLAKNPAGYLVSSIRDDYQAPEGYLPPDNADQLAQAEAAVAEQERRRREAELEAEKQLRAAEAAETARLNDLRARWEALSSADRAAIKAQVKAAHPGLGRSRTALQRFCLEALEAHPRGEGPPGQPLLFPDENA